MSDPHHEATQNPTAATASAADHGESAKPQPYSADSIERLVRLEYLQGFLREQLQDIKSFLSRFFWAVIVAAGGIAGTIFWSTMNLIERSDTQISPIQTTLVQHTALLNEIKAQTSNGAMRTQMEKELSTPMVLRFENLDGSFSAYRCGPPMPVVNADETIGAYAAIASTKARDCVEVRATPATTKELPARAARRPQRPR